MRRNYHTLDVFTDTPLAGNPLAVVLDADGLDDARMQQIAREFNLPETVFVVAPRDPVNTGGAAHLHPGPRTALRRASDGRRGGAARAFARAATARRAGPAPGPGRKGRRRRLRRAPSPRPGAGGLFSSCRACRSRPERRRPPRNSPNASASKPADIGFGAHRPTVYGAGVDFLFAPIAERRGDRQGEPGSRALGRRRRSRGLSLHARDERRRGATYRARMFASGWGIREDPATGAAASAFAGVVMEFDQPADGEHSSSSSKASKWAARA